MGYDTNYKLTIENRGDPLLDLGELRTIRVDDGYSDLGELLDHGDVMKWYEHEQEMRAVSARFPELLFSLSGQGDERGDLWTKYFLAGRCQEARAQIAPFDPDKLR